MAPSAKVDLPLARKPDGVKYRGIKSSSLRRALAVQVFAPGPVTFFTRDAHHKPALEVSIERRL
jgi:hypothetical protein